MNPVPSVPAARVSPRRAAAVSAGARASGSLRAAASGLVLLLSFVAGCASVPQRAPVAMPSPAAPQDWAQRRALLQAESAFALKGRLAVAAGEEGFSAGLRWTQHDHEALIDLDGPLGVGGLRLRAAGETLELVGARGERLDGEAARAELERRLGFPLPLAALRYWVRGVPDPARRADEQLAPDGSRLLALEQDGWRVEYPAYVEDPAAGPLPRRLNVARGGARLRLVVESWSPRAGS